MCIYCDVCRKRHGRREGPSRDAEGATSLDCIEQAFCTIKYWLKAAMAEPDPEDSPNSSEVELVQAFTHLRVRPSRRRGGPAARAAAAGYGPSGASSSAGPAAASAPPAAAPPPAG
eukprot:8585968-Alexandrium_andersonii.AAC.1